MCITYIFLRADTYSCEEKKQTGSVVSIFFSYFSSSTTFMSAIRQNCLSYSCEKKDSYGISSVSFIFRILKQIEHLHSSQRRYSH